MGALRLAIGVVVPLINVHIADCMHMQGSINNFTVNVQLTVFLVIIIHCLLLIMCLLPGTK